MEQIFDSTLTAQTGSYPFKPIRQAQDKPTEYIVRCAMCGHQGVFDKDIVDTDYVDSTGWDSVRLECRDVEICITRQRAGRDKMIPWWLKKDCCHCVSYGMKCPYIERKTKNPRGCSLYSDLEPGIEMRQELP